MMLALTLVFSCSNQEVSLQTISTEENNPYKWDESFHVNSSTRASESPNEAYEFVPDGLTSVEHSQGPFDSFFYGVDRNAQLLGHLFEGFAFVSTEDKHAPAVVGQRDDSFSDFLLQFFLQHGVERIGC